MQSILSQEHAQALGQMFSLYVRTRAVDVMSFHAIYPDT